MDLRKGFILDVLCCAMIVANLLTPSHAREEDNIGLHFIASHATIHRGTNVTLTCSYWSARTFMIAINYNWTQLLRQKKAINGRGNISYTIIRFSEVNEGTYYCGVWEREWNTTEDRHYNKKIHLNMTDVKYDKTSSTPTLTPTSTPLPTLTPISTDFSEVLNTSTRDIIPRQHLQTLTDIENMTSLLYITSDQAYAVQILRNNVSIVIYRKEEGETIFYPDFLNMSVRNDPQNPNIRAVKLQLNSSSISDITQRCGSFENINGKYTILVNGSNSVKRKYHFQIDILDPIKRESDGSVRARVGSERVSLTCPGCYYHETAIEWRTPKGMKRRTNQSNLLLANISHGDLGEYLCWAENMEARSKVTLHLTQEEPKDSPNMVMYGAVGGSALLLLVIILALLVCSKRQKDVSKEMKSKSHERAPEFSVLTATRIDIPNPASGSDNENEIKEKYEGRGRGKPTDVDFLDPRSLGRPKKASNLYIDRPLLAPGQSPAPPPTLLHEDGPDYENIERLPQKDLKSRNNSVPLKSNRTRERKRPMTDADVEYCDLDLVGESGTKDGRGRPVIRGQHSTVDYAEIILDYKPDNSWDSSRNLDQL